MTDYPLASSTWDDRERAAIQRVVDSDRFTMGPEVAQYERDFAQYFGSKHAVMVSSGSAANLLMIAALFYTKNPALKLKRGDEIIVPAVSWSTTYFPLQQYGLKVKFVDIDRGTLNIDLEKLEAAITSQTRAILAVNLLGNPNDFSRIQALTTDKNIVLLEDNCEAMGASLNGQHTGTFGVMGTFSSFFSHHISTMEGGCLVTDNEELYHVLLCLRAHGWTRDLPAVNHVSGRKSEDPFEESFNFVLPGYNVRPLEMSGAIGIEQLKKLPQLVRARRENAQYFRELFEEHPFVETQRETDQSSWFGFALTLKSNAPYTRTTLVNQLTEKGIECRPIVGGNFLKNSRVLQHFNYEVAGSLDSAEYIDAQGLFVGNHHRDLSRELESLSRVLQSLTATYTRPC